MRGRSASTSSGFRVLVLTIVGVLTGMGLEGREMGNELHNSVLDFGAHNRGCVDRIRPGRIRGASSTSGFMVWVITSVGILTGGTWKDKGKCGRMRERAVSSTIGIEILVLTIVGELTGRDLEG